MKSFLRSIPSRFIIGVKDFHWSKELETFLEEFQGCGLALFNSPFDSADNIWSDPKTALEAVYDFIHEAAERTPCLAVDQEGGRVRRLRHPFIELPSAERIGIWLEEGRDPSTIEKLYSLAATQMAMTRLNVNLAPVCDFRYKDSHDVIGDRSFGATPELVLQAVEIFCRAFEAKGIHTILKHLPGHGPSQRDSHQEVALLFKEQREIIDFDFQVFRRAISWASGVLTAHIAFPEMPDRIFSLDLNFINQFRELLAAPKALWLTDDLLSMKAVSERKPWIDAFQCPYDGILLCGSLDQAANALEDVIRFAEQEILDFAKQQEIEKRAKDLKSRFQRTEKMLPFKDWAKKICEIEKQAHELAIYA